MRATITILVGILLACATVAFGRSSASERARVGHTLSHRTNHHTESNQPTNHHHHHERTHLPHSTKPPKEFDAANADRSVYTGFKATALPLTEPLPTDWDWCATNEGRSFCTSSWNQHIPQYCGSCYVHGALHAANDRIKLLMDAHHDVLLARQVILNCGPSKGLGAGCDGGEVFDVYEFMYRYGLPDESCQNYIARSNHKDTDRCDAIDVCMNCMPSIRNESKTECWEVISPIRYWVREYGLVSGEEAIQNEIYQRGPVTCAFASVDDFDYNYRGGIYIDHTNATDSNHDVEVVGWGVDSETGMKFWKARNSWGTYWGENSFFKIVRGINNMRFEEECVFALFSVHELDAVLAGKLRGSMFGLVKEAQPNVTEVGYEKSDDDSHKKRHHRAHKRRSEKKTHHESDDELPHRGDASHTNKASDKSSTLMAHHGKLPLAEHKANSDRHSNRYWKEKYGQDDDDVDLEPGTSNVNMNLNLNLNFKNGQTVISSTATKSSRHAQHHAREGGSEPISGAQLERELAEQP